MKQTAAQKLGSTTFDGTTAAFLVNSGDKMAVAHGIILLTTTISSTYYYQAYQWHPNLT